MTNAERAARAQKAMIAYVGSDQYSAEDYLPDLICDLLHLAAQDNDTDVEPVIRSAISNFVAESLGEDHGLGPEVITTIIWKK